jgi:hypothetical protein
MRVILAALSGAVLALGALAACSQASKHPPELGDCTDPKSACTFQLPVPLVDGAGGGDSAATNDSGGGTNDSGGATTDASSDVADAADGPSDATGG